MRGHRRLFRNLHFRLEAGSALHIRGANGVGKTSLLKLLCGLSLPESGEVRWNDAPILKNRTEYYRALAYLGHHTALNRALTPPENLTASRALGTHTDKHADKHTALSVQEALHQFNLDDCRALPCGLLSTGQRQRVALAGILLTRGGIWILDEPATALDEIARQFLEDMLGAQLKAGGMVVFTSHRPLASQQIHAQSLDLTQFQ